MVNLAAQAGVRHSLEKPLEYIDSNVVGFTTILEGCRQHFHVIVYEYFEFLQEDMCLFMNSRPA